MLKKSTLTIIFTAFLTLIIVIGIGGYIIFQQQPQREQQHDQNDPQSLANWSYTLHHDVARTGYSNSTGPLTNQTLWTHVTQMQIEYCSPAVVDGVAYFGSNDYRVRAVNATTGDLIWRYLTGNSVESSCTVCNGIVYFGSHDHNVYALNATTGDKIWNYTTGDEVNGSPTVANGVLYVGSKDYNVYALDVSTGNKIWSYTTGYPIESTPSIANGILYIGSNDAKVYAFED